VVAVTVTPSVNSTPGSPASASATLVDHAPSATVTLTGPGKTPNGPWRPSGQLTAEATASDPDGDDVRLTYV
jgi:hypothetical protein